MNYKAFWQGIQAAEMSTFMIYVAFAMQVSMESKMAILDYKDFLYSEQLPNQTIRSYREVVPRIKRERYVAKQVFPLL